MNRLLGNIVWFLTALGAIHLGLIGLGSNIFEWEGLPLFIGNMERFLHLVMGIAGLISLFMWGKMQMAGGLCSCGCKKASECC